MIDKSNTQIIGHIWIRDPDTNETLVKKRDNNIPAVHPEIAPEHDTGGDHDDQ